MRQTFVACVIVTLASGPISAQVAPWPGRFRLSAAAAVQSGSREGEIAANLVPNVPEPSDPFRLFASDVQRDASPGLEARLAVVLVPSFGIEGGAGYSRPRLRVTLRDDAERAAQATAEERLTSVSIDVAALFHLDRIVVARGRGRPFVRAGGGYLRELHEGNQLVETGRVYHAGGGMDYLLGTRDGFFKGLAARGDVRAVWRDGGVTVEGRRHAGWAAGGGLLLLF
jgi:hypothetical protein